MANKKDWIWWVGGAAVLVAGAFYFLIYLPEKNAMQQDIAEGRTTPPFRPPFDLIFGQGQ